MKISNCLYLEDSTVHREKRQNILFVNLRDAFTQEDLKWNVSFYLIIAFEKYIKFR